MVLSHLTAVGVVVAVVVNWLFGWLWHSPVLFGNVWVKHVKVPIEDLKAGMQSAMIFGFVSLVVQVLLMGLLLSLIRPGNLREAFDFGLVAWLAIQLPFLLNLWVYEQRKPVMVAINGGYSLISTMLTAIILTIAA